MGLSPIVPQKDGKGGWHLQEKRRAYPARIAGVYHYHWKGDAGLWVIFGARISEPKLSRDGRLPIDCRTGLRRTRRSIPVLQGSVLRYFWHRFRVVAVP